jgi:glycosyltransferase involved in cell wall biosynthesis
VTSGRLPMRIAFVITRSDIIGGASLHVLHLAASLQRQGHEVLVVVGGSGPFVAELNAAELRVIALPQLQRAIRPRDDLRAYFALRRELAAFGPTLISTHTSKAGALGRLAARSLGVPATYSPHGWTFAEESARGRRAAYAALERLLAHLPGTIVTVSHDEDAVGQRAGIGGRRARVTIHNGVADVGDEMLACARREPPVIISVARFEAPKDHTTLLRALGRLLDLDFRVQLVGDGPELAAARCLVSELALQDRVEFLGHRRDVAELLARGQVFALSSRSESFPMTVLEAMRARLPVVASNVGGISEAVVDGHTGLLVEIGSADAWADSLKRVLVDNETREVMGANGRTRYLELFGHDRMVDRITSLYLRPPERDRSGRRTRRPRWVEGGRRPDVVMRLE